MQLPLKPSSVRELPGAVVHHCPSFVHNHDCSLPNTMQHPAGCCWLVKTAHTSVPQVIWHGTATHAPNPIRLGKPDPPPGGSCVKQVQNASNPHPITSRIKESLVAHIAPNSHPITSIKHSTCMSRCQYLLWTPCCMLQPRPRAPAQCCASNHAVIAPGLCNCRCC